MSKMWHGPSAALKSAQESPLYRRITRRCGSEGIFFTMAPDGRSAEVFTIREYRKYPLGVVNGSGPFGTALTIARDRTPLDAELIAQNVEYLEMASAEIVELFGLYDRIEAAMAELADAHETIIERFDSEPCPLIVNGKHTYSGLPGGACEECMNTGIVRRV